MDRVSTICEDCNKLDYLGEIYQRTDGKTQQHVSDKIMSVCDSELHLFDFALNILRAVS